MGKRRGGQASIETMAAMPGMLSLASAAGQDLGRTADIASNILSGMGFSADQMGYVGRVKGDIEAEVEKTAKLKAKEEIEVEGEKTIMAKCKEEAEIHSEKEITLKAPQIKIMGLLTQEGTLTPRLTFSLKKGVEL